MINQLEMDSEREIEMAKILSAFVKANEGLFSLRILNICEDLIKEIEKHEKEMKCQTNKNLTN